MNRRRAARLDSLEANARHPFTTRRKRWRVSGLGLAVLGWLSAASVLAQTNSPPQILFLHLMVTNQAVSLVATSTRPGVLKPTRNAVGDDLHYEVFSATSESLWKGAAADPRIRHLEYEDPPGSGNLKHKIIVLEEVEFTIRVPALPQAKRIDFYKLETASPGVSGEKTRKSLGSVLLP